MPLFLKPFLWFNLDAAGRQSPVMSNSSPPEPPSSDRKRLTKDEWIAIIVAFTTIGFIFFWLLGRRDGGFSFKDSQFTLNLPKPVSVPTPPGKQLPLPQTTGSLGSDSEQSPLPQATGSLDSDSEQPDSEQAPSPQTTTSPTTDTKQSSLSEETASKTSKLSKSDREEETASVESPEAIAPTTSPIASPTPLVPPIEFSDIPDNYWANYFIVALSQRQIIAGFPNRSFEPNKPVTRAELASIIEKVFDKANTNEAIAFQDIPNDYWATPAIDEVVKTGFMKGYPGKIFRPSENISRVQVLIALVSGLDTAPKSTPEKTLDIYQDQEQIPKWAREKVATATQSGLVVNYPNRELLHPNEPATRAEVAAMIYQALVLSGQAPEYSSQYIIPPRP